MFFPNVKATLGRVQEPGALAEPLVTSLEVIVSIPSYPERLALMRNAQLLVWSLLLVLIWSPGAATPALLHKITLTFPWPRVFPRFSQVKA